MKYFLFPSIALLLIFSGCGDRELTAEFEGVENLEECPLETVPVCGMAVIDCESGMCAPQPTSFTNACFAAYYKATDVVEGLCPQDE